RRARRRAPALTAAAAVVAVAAVFAPIFVSQGDGPARRPTGAGSAPAEAKPDLPELGKVVRDGESLRAFGYLRGDRYCTMIVPPGEPTVRPTCEPVPTWPGDSLVHSRELLNGDPADDTGMLAKRLVFLTDPRVVTLTARRGDGSPVTVTEFDRNEHAAAFLADFAGPVVGFGYTARDGRGRVLAEAIG
ncbi:hypothetical protein, partial [Actinophytocola sp.]|uniref:hypothetical protein n=1 Tax=Actinophytocola sp. TaxID=1872138 RepID=UPI003D6C54E1